MPSPKPIYLDHAASCPLNPEVARKMSEWNLAHFGNASSLHSHGRRAKAAIDEARERVAQQLGCLFGEVLFTSSGTEAANMAILGTAISILKGEFPGRCKFIFSAAEHHCVLHTQDALRAMGMEVILCPVDKYSRPDLQWLAENVDHKTALVATMHANNELGVLHDLSSVHTIVKAQGALLLIDAVQTFCALPFTVDSLGADFVTISAHKIYGPPGIGAIYLRSGVKITPLIVGGAQEREMRAGSENVASIIGFGEAIQQYRPALPEAREAFFKELDGIVKRSVPGDVPQLPGHAHFRIPGIKSEPLLIALDRLGISASAGAACSSGSIEPSHVLLACGWGEERSGEGVRFSFGTGQTSQTAKEVAERLREALERF